MEETLKTKIRALEEENERLKTENINLRSNSGGGSIGISRTSFDGCDDDSFEAWTVGSLSPLPKKQVVSTSFKQQPLKPPFRVSARFKSFGFGLERLEWISKARINQIWIENLN